MVEATITKQWTPDQKYQTARDLFDALCKVQKFICSDYCYSVHCPECQRLNKVLSDAGSVLIDWALE